VTMILEYLVRVANLNFCELKFAAVTSAACVLCLPSPSLRRCGLRDTVVLMRCAMKTHTFET
jgi:hypothetical protein